MSRLTLPSLPLLQRRRVHAGGWKNCVYGSRGSWNSSNHVCVVYEKLSRVCVQVKFEKATCSWSLAMNSNGQHAGYGCSFHKHYRPAGYRNCMGSGSRNARSPDAVNFNDLEVLVRSVDDPYLVAMTLTNGTASFGWSRKQIWSSAVLLLVVGTLLALPGTLMCVRALVCRQMGSNSGASDSKQGSTVASRTRYSSIEQGQHDAENFDTDEDDPQYPL